MHLIRAIFSSIHPTSSLYVRLILQNKFDRAIFVGKVLDELSSRTHAEVRGMSSVQRPDHILTINAQLRRKELTRWHIDLNGLLNQSPYTATPAEI
ncbi:hypothetical protein PGT21_026246 [Puccinia graminis f. sp. tritici]|uniref:Uncharacterized protein n=1 Tax=Puccinia graminis f. sp. tritici TaxID=56615 RepID=A0A5B0MVH9_PUCGR|nr:hypothetical protein PGT21_026246 [Puccinia graminis f. sp. tritici]KAA1131113.1 hypothetical protein PGTUg99_009562 [Puccinia graminis f. sp. tritici]